MNKDYSKNPYYKDEDIKKAKDLCKRFYNRDYVPKLFATGNKKLGSNVMIWDLPSIITCKYKCKDCYALKAERMYKQTRVCRAFHYEIIKDALKDNNKKEYLKNYMQVELNRHKLLYKLPVVRIHASGDLFNADYLSFWIDIINANKDINFYTYTKILTNQQIDLVNSLHNNFNIVKSMIDDKYINYGNLEYIEDLTTKLDADKKEYYVCGYGFEGNYKTCMGDCTACLHCPNVIFKKH